MKVLILVLISADLMGCEEGASVKGVIASNPIGNPAVPTPTPVQAPVWTLILDGQGDQFSMGAVIGDGGVNIHAGLGPTLIPVGTQFSIQFNVSGSFTILGVSRINGPAVLNVALFRDGILMESGFIGANGMSYSFNQW